jgi:hypothetical protein
MRRRGDKGAATSILVVIMALLLVAAMMLLSRIARANDLRTRAQAAADAAALAAVAEIRDRGAFDMVRGLIPQGEIYQRESADAAQEYAAKNGSEVDSVHASGFFGYTVRVTLHTLACEPKPSHGQAPMHFTCEHGEQGLHGTATATAHLEFPTCGFGSFFGGGTGHFCAGESSGSYEAARRMFTIRLVDEEDSTAFFPDYSTRAHEVGRQLADLYGWSGASWGCLDTLWGEVSGWNQFAVNPVNGGYGIPGAHPAAAMAKYGPDFMSNPVTQVRWGIDYISTTYQNPCVALTVYNSHIPPSY